MMEDNLDLTGQMQGGFLQSVMRRLANGESFFQQKITATRGDGDCLLSPQMPGGMQILEVGQTQYCIADESYVAATENVNVTAQMQNIGTAIFGDNGGFFIGRSSGQGQLVVSGFGSIFTIDVTPDKPILIDNGHVVAWDAQLHHEISASTNQNSGFFRNLVNSVTSSEGILLKFSGNVKIVFCSLKIRPN